MISGNGTEKWFTTRFQILGLGTHTSSNHKKIFCSGHQCSPVKAFIHKNNLHWFPLCFEPLFHEQPFYEGGIRVCGDAVLRCFWCGFSKNFFQPAVLRFTKTLRFAVI